MPNANSIKLELAKRLIWWEKPEKAIQYDLRLLAQIMVLGTWDDVQKARSIWPQSAFRAVLNHPSPGLLVQNPGITGMLFFICRPLLCQHAIQDLTGEEYLNEIAFRHFTSRATASMGKQDHQRI